VNTTTTENSPFGRRRRRQYSSEFKAEVIAACQQPGVSIAAIALIHHLNANLLRRWVGEAEGTSPKPITRRIAPAPSALTAPVAPAFVPIRLDEANSRPSEIRVEIQRGPQSVSVSWPISAATECGTWLREWLK
jgi:transposase